MKIGKNTTGENWYGFEIIESTSPHCLMSVKMMHKPAVERVINYFEKELARRIEVFSKSLDYLKHPKLTFGPEKKGMFIDEQRELRKIKLFYKETKDRTEWDNAIAHTEEKIYIFNRVWKEFINYLKTYPSFAEIIKKYVETFTYKPDFLSFGKNYDFYYGADLHQIYSKYSGVSVESFGSSSNEERWENAYEFSFYNSQFDTDRYFIKHRPDEYKVKSIR
jgi:hypothetical protein